MADAGFTLPIGHRITLPGHFDVPVTLEDARPVGSSYEFRVRLPDGTLDEAVISADEARMLAGIDLGPATTAKPVDAEKMRLLIESARIRLAYAYDQQFAVSLSGIRTLPHQVEAVYERMLPQPRLRFLLADDPGAGKTIMAGLLIKELIARGDLHACAVTTDYHVWCWGYNANGQLGAGPTAPMQSAVPLAVAGAFHCAVTGPLYLVAAVLCISESV